MVRAVPKLPPLLPMGEVTLRGFQHVGTEILLNWTEGNLLIGCARTCRAPFLKDKISF
jgi:hypothetical protein